MEALPLAGTVVGGLLGDKGGGQSQTASKEPWAAAAPWLQDLLSQGQSLSSYYTQNPFNVAQTQAYGNMADQGAYMRSLIPSLLGQLQSQPLAFDRAYPSARPQPFNWGLTGGAGGSGLPAQGGGMGLLSGGGINPVSTMPTTFAAPPVPTPAPAATQLPNLWFDPAGKLAGNEGYKALQMSYANGENRF